jgi:hypothetical protein
MHLDADMTRQLAEKLIDLYAPNITDAYTDVYEHPTFNDDKLVCCFLEIVKEDDRFKAFLGSFVAGACKNRKDKLASETIRVFNDLYKFDPEVFDVVMGYDLLHTFQQYINNSEFKASLLQKLQSDDFCRQFLQKACVSGSRKCFLKTLCLLNEDNELETDGGYLSVISIDIVKSLVSNILSCHNEAEGEDWRDVLNKLVELQPTEVDKQRVYECIIVYSLLREKSDIAQKYLDMIVSVDSGCVGYWIMICFTFSTGNSCNFFDALCTKLRDLNYKEGLVNRELCATLAIDCACRKNESLVMKLLDEFQCDYKQSDVFGDTVLHACERNMFSDANLLTVFHRSGAEVIFNTKNKMGLTPVQCRRRQSYPTVRKFRSLENLSQYSQCSDDNVHRLKSKDDTHLFK